MQDDPLGRGPEEAFWRRALKPKSILDYWAAVAFLVAVGRLCLLDRPGARVLLVFLGPPALALTAKANSDRRSTRFIATLFLTLIDVGVLLAPFQRIFPRLGASDIPLPASDKRILVWYLLIYVLYIFCILPPFMFIRGLVDKRRHRPSELSRFTCIFGLAAWAFVGPLFVWWCFTELGLWPIIGS